MKFRFFQNWKRRQRYAALAYVGTTNLGDEIQTLAAKRFLPRVDAWADRERLDSFQSLVPHKIILNGWFLHRPEHWPPSPRLRPLIISFHLTRQVHPTLNLGKLTPMSTVLSPNGISYLKEHEPIGTRDLDTLRQLQEAGVNSYFSGCLTLTLRLPSTSSRQDVIYAVDVSDEIFARISDRSNVPVVRLTHADGTLAGKARFDRAERLVRTYSTARAVVTSRLHCALPCLAFGTPVLFIERAPDSYRFAGLRDLLRHSSEGEFLEGRDDFDLKTPPPNGREWCTLRDQLEAKCEAFVAAA